MHEDSKWDLKILSKPPEPCSTTVTIPGKHKIRPCGHDKLLPLLGLSFLVCKLREGDLHADPPEITVVISHGLELFSDGWSFVGPILHNSKDVEAPPAFFSTSVKQTSR